MKRKPKTKIMNKFLLSGLPPILLLMFFTGMPEYINAQQVTPMVVCSGGETFTGNGLSLDFTVGEIMTESLSTTGLLLTQGFIQGADKNTGIDENFIDENDLLVYPNPASDRIYLTYDKTKANPVSVDIKDLQGRTILRAGFDVNPITVKLDRLSPGFYTVSVLFDNRQTINKKIIKQ